MITETQRYGSPHGFREWRGFAVGQSREVCGCGITAEFVGLASATAVVLGDQQQVPLSQCCAASSWAAAPGQPPRRRFLSPAGRHMAVSLSAPSRSGFCGSLALGRSRRVRFARLCAADRLGPARCPVHVAVLVVRTALHKVAPGGALSRPLPGVADSGRIVAELVSGPGADYDLARPAVRWGPSVYPVRH